MENSIVCSLIVWNETEHEKLYLWRRDSKTKDTSYATFFSHSRKLFVISDPRKNRRKRYICFKPNSTRSVAEPLIEKEVANHQNINKNTQKPNIYQN